MDRDKAELLVMRIERLIDSKLEELKECVSRGGVTWETENDIYEAKEALTKELTEVGKWKE